MKKPVLICLLFLTIYFNSSASGDSLPDLGTLDKIIDSMFIVSIKASDRLLLRETVDIREMEILIGRSRIDGISSDLAAKKISFLKKIVIKQVRRIGRTATVEKYTEIKKFMRRLMEISPDNVLEAFAVMENTARLYIGRPVLTSSDKSLYSGDALFALITWEDPKRNTARRAALILHNGVNGYGFLGYEGLEDELRLGLHIPLSQSTDPLYSNNAVRFDMYDAVSPGENRLGFGLAVVPIGFMVLYGNINLFSGWRLGDSIGGYAYADSLTASKNSFTYSNASGYFGQGGLILQMDFSYISRKLPFIIRNDTRANYWNVPGHDYYKTGEVALRLIKNGTFVWNNFCLLYKTRGMYPYFFLNSHIDLYEKTTSSYDGGFGALWFWPHKATELNIVIDWYFVERGKKAALMASKPTVFFMFSKDIFKHQLKN